MLDTQTKKRIDDCRDILVGKLPDPKAQIEQITIGLIYKFMDDMDKEAVELGGQAKFFSDYKVPDPEFPNDRSKDKLVEFSKYAWDKLLHPKVTAAVMLTLYAEAIVGMEKNPNIPQLFRDIFKNAFLPYRDPETLKLFLKTIGEFEYTHSEKLGDAFEYLLSVMGSQGDAGQFRTPRHIIDFLVAIVDPDKKDSILDPACGTAGFLISAYKHILLKYSKDNKEGLNIFQYNQLEKKPFNNLGDQLTPDDRKKLIQNFVGYDISPDMVRLSLVNLYLHNFNTPNIHEYDTLSSEERWNETSDVVLANPPFMSPKGGIRPHKKFTISSNRSEVLFVDYIAEHLNTKGKAGIIVPEGVIFQSGKAYKDLRKMLVDNYLYAVVSLPAGVFNPYSGVKTSILFMDRAIAKQHNEILFVKIDNDGYGLGAQRNAVKGGQLDDAIELVKQFKSGDFIESEIAHAVAKTEIAKNGDYNLSGERYKETIATNSNFEFKQLGELCELIGGGTPSKSENEFWENGDIKWISSRHIDNYGNIIGNDWITEKGLNNSSSKIAPQDSIIFITRVSVGKYAIANSDYAINQDLTALVPKSKLLFNRYLYAVAPIVSKFIDRTAVGIGVRGINRKQLAEIQIPLPPLSIQEEIVAEIDGYQQIISGAKMVVENYKPKIDIDADWEMVELQNICESISDGDHQPPPKSERGIPFITISNIKGGGVIDFSKTYFVPNKYYHDIKAHRKPQIDDILYTVTGSFGIPVLIDFNKEFCFQRHIGLIRPNSEINSKYLFYYLMSPDAFLQAEKVATGMAQKTVALKELRKFIIPKPPIDEQFRIVSKIEKEQKLVNANKQLIEIFEQKIKDRIAKVWGD